MHGPRPFEPMRAFAICATVSFGVLGWLAAQWLTFGIVERAHLTAGGVSAHRHGYAGPLVMATAVLGVLSLLTLFVLHLGLPPGDLRALATGPGGDGGQDGRS